MPLIPFPDVPNVPGVPTIARYAGLAVLPAPVMALADSLNLPFLQQLTQWGVFTVDGSPVLIPDSIGSFTFRNGSKVSDYPVEQGAFGSYNKVASPFEPRLVMLVGGTTANKSAFLATLDALVAQTDTLYNVLTPERVYLNVTFESYDMERTSSKGVTLLTINVSLREVRVVNAAIVSSTQSVSAASTVDRGQVQPVIPSASAIQDIAGKNGLNLTVSQVTALSKVVIQ